MQHNKILKYFFLVLFFCAISGQAISKNGTFAYVKDGISQDSISKNEIAEFRKKFESVEKMIATKRGNYDDAKRLFDGLRNSRVHNLPEFAGRFSATQSKLTAWNLEVNPKQPPVVVPNNPSTPPRNTSKANEKVQPLGAETEHKSLMLTYFPDTLTVGNDFLAYVEITKDYTVKFGNLNANNNSTLDTILISSLAPAAGTGMTATQVSVELSRDGGADNFAINSRSDKTKTLNDNSKARWEWNLNPNSAGDTRLRLSVTYQKQNKDGSMSEVSAINKFIVVKGLAKKTTEPESNILWWIIGGIILVIIIILIAMSKGRKDKHNKHVEKHHEEKRTEEKRIIER